MPTRNHRESQFEGAASICGEMLKKDHVQRRSACRGCIIGCARRTSAGGQTGEGPEYETIWALGAQCGVSDLTAIVQANYACNRAGMDTITMGSTIACAMELTDLGLLPGGPRFGDARAIIELAEATAAGEGLGAELGLGSARFAALLRPAGALHERQAARDARLRPARHEGPGPRVRHQQPRRLPPARQHARPRDPRRPQDGRPLRHRSARPACSSTSRTSTPCSTRSASASSPPSR